MKKYAKKLCLFIIAVMILPMFEQGAAAKENSFIDERYLLVAYAGGRVAYFEGGAEETLHAPYCENGTIMLPYEPIYKTFLEKLTANAAHGGKVPVELAEKEGTEYINGEIFTYLGYKTYLDTDGLFVVSRDGGFDFGDKKTLYDLGGIYVSAGGRLLGEGYTYAPLKSIGEAVKTAEKRIKEYGRQYPIYIFIHGGKYCFDETVTLEQEVFSDNKYKGLAIRAFGDGKTVFSGAKQIDASNFAPVGNAEELARLPKEGRGRVAKLSLSGEKIKKLDENTESFPFLYLNDIEQIQSRWPNNDWAKVKTIDGKSFGYEGENPGRWTKAYDARIYAFFSADYFYMSSRVASVNPGNSTITLSDNRFSPGRTGARWYATNLLEEIDIPGEYFVDRRSMELFYYPPYSMKNCEMELVTFLDKPMIKADYIKNLTVSGIDFEKTGGSAIDINGAENVLIENCSFRYVQADYAVNAAKNTYNITIRNNECYGCGGGLINLKSGDIDTIKSGEVLVENNWIASSGYLPRAIAGAVFSPRANSARNASCGITVRNNLIQDCNNVYAISTEGVNNSVLYNEIINQGKNIDDGGCIYIGRAATLRGVDIGFNYIHYLNKEHSYGGLYNDDGYCGASWHHNICADMNRASIHGVGMDQKYMYNISYDCIYPVLAGDRMTWGGTTSDDMKNETRLTLEKFSKYYDAVFPEMTESLEREPFFAPWNTVFFGNIGVMTGGKTITTQKIETLEIYGAKKIAGENGEIDITGENGTDTGNPHYDDAAQIFKDAANQNFELNPESDAAKKYSELLKIKMSDIGLRDTSILKKPEGFRLKSPYNGETKLYTNNLTFTWDCVQGASKYRIVVAKDRDFEEIVIDETVRENGNCNMYRTESLANDTVYYWKVYAIGIARQNEFVVENKGGAQTFKTAKNNEVDKSGLKRTIVSVNSFLNSENIGDYDAEYIQNLKNEVNRAQKIYDTSKVQSTVDETEEKLYALILKSVYNMQYEYETPDDSFFDAKNWSAGFGTVDNPEPGVIRYSAAGKGGNAVVNIADSNKILCLRMKMTSLQNKEYQGFYYKYNKNNKGYLCVFKETFLEFQKAGISLDTLYDERLKSDEWYDVEMGAVNTAYGVMQFLRVNGRLMYAKTDDDVTQTRDGGLFMVHASSYSDIYIKKAEKLPEKADIMAEIFDAFNNPESAEQLGCALTGMGDAMELGGELYNALDKQEIAEAIYPMVVSGKLHAEADNFADYREEVMRQAVIAAYNSGLTDKIYKNNLELLYKQEVGYEDIDQNGVNLYDFYCTRLKDKDKAEINIRTASGNYKTFEDIRKAFAQNVIMQSIAACGTSFAADTAYMDKLLTKENADYAGLDISQYLKMAEQDRTRVNVMLGRCTGFEDIKDLENKIKAFVSE